MSQDDNIHTAMLYDPMLIKERFVAAMAQTLNNLSQTEAVHVRAKLIDILGTWSAATIASPDMLGQASDYVFEDEPLRDWIFATKFVFFMSVSAGGGIKVVHTLLTDIALAASENMDATLMLSAEELAEVEKARAVPDQLFQDLPNASQTRTILASNTWLLVLMMLFAFVDLDHVVLKTPEPEPAKKP